MIGQLGGFIAQVLRRYPDRKTRLLVMESGRPEDRVEIVTTRGVFEVSVEEDGVLKVRSIYGGLVIIPEVSNVVSIIGEHRLREVDRERYEDIKRLRAEAERKS